MLKTKKVLSMLLIITFFTMLLGDLTMPKARADALMTLSVQKDTSMQNKITDTSVTLEWNNVFGVKSYRISYQDYADDNIGVAKSVYTDITKTSYEVTGLEPNIIYDFTVEAMTNLNGQGSAIASDNIKVITAIAFQSSNLTDTVIQNNFDRETGAKPALNLQWRIPLEWDGSKFDYVDSSLVNYKVSVGVTKAATDAGMYNVKYNGVAYEVYKENIPADVKLAYAPVTMVGGNISYEWRYWDPVNNAINDATIKPGTIYYMKILPQFSSTIGDIEYRITPLSNGYAYTPLHIKVGKDSNDNIVCTIYRINYDSNDGKNKINFKYEMYSSPDTGMASSSLEGYEFEQYGDSSLPIEIFIPRKDETSTFYYLAMAKSDGLDNIHSPIIDYNMASDAGRPPIPQEISVESMSRVTGTVGGTTVKSADINLQLGEPYGFDNSKANLDFYILISSAQSEIADSKGNFYKEVIDDNEYDIKYRLVKVVNGANFDIDTSEEGYIKYTLNGLDLFTEDDGTPIANDDDYPEQIKLNKVYYLKIFTKKIDAGTVSDFSVPLSFTTPTEALRKPPIPEMFNADQIKSSQIRLVWQRAQINLEDYDAQGQNYSVYYEVYMNDTISKNSDGSYKQPFVFLGSDENPLHAIFTVGTGNNFTIRYAVLDNFTGSDEFTQRFGSNVKPNTVYYYTIRTKLIIQGKPEAMYSELSQILPVTTTKDKIAEPGDDEKIPQATLDFAVQLDADGNKKVDSYSAAFTWTKMQENVTYRIARTLKPIDAADDISKLQNGQGYDLNQYLVPQTLTPNSGTEFVYGVDALWPNTVYYFSMRAERAITQNGVADAVYSAWTTVPVTTFMVEAPDTFQLIKDSSYNKYTQLKVSWRAKEYFDSEIWIRTDSQNDYTKWTSVSITSDKPAGLQGTSYKMSYAIISNLKSSTRYYIKIRNRISRTVNVITLDDYSKFAGPLDSRTEFSQSDYNDNEKENEEQIIFNDRMQGLSQVLYWTLENSESTTKIKLRGTKTINSISYGNSSKLIIDLTGLEDDSTEKTIYIPINVFDYINKNNKMISIKGNFGEMLFRPKTLDGLHKDIQSIKKEIGQEDSDIKDVFIRFKVKKIESGSAMLPSSMKDNLTSNVIQFSVDVLGMSNTDQNLETKADSKLSNLLQSNLNRFINASSSLKDTSQELESLIQEYINDCKSDLGDYMESETEDLIEETKSLLELSNPVQIKLVYNTTLVQGQQTAYQYIDSKWNKLATQVNNIEKTAVFEAKKPSMNAVFKNSSQNGNSTNSQLAKQFGDLDSKYGISEEILTNGTYDGRVNVSFKQMMGVVGKILGGNVQDNDNDVISAVSKKLDLNDRLSKLSQDHKLTREEAAYIALKLYSARTGVGVDNLKPSKAINIADAKQVNTIYYKAVIMAVDLKLISVDSSNKILPMNLASKDTGLQMIKKVLSLTGDI